MLTAIRDASIASKVVTPRFLETLPVIQGHKGSHGHRHHGNQREQEDAFSGKQLTVATLLYLATLGGAHLCKRGRRLYKLYMMYDTSTNHFKYNLHVNTDVLISEIQPCLPTKSCRCPRLAEPSSAHKATARQLSSPTCLNIKCPIHVLSIESCFMFSRASYL